MEILISNWFSKTLDLFYGVIISYMMNLHGLSSIFNKGHARIFDLNNKVTYVSLCDSISTFLKSFKTDEVKLKKSPRAINPNYPIVVIFYYH